MTDIAAGWYNDPEYPSQLRYWDGTRWTEHRSPAPTHDPVANGDSMAIVSGAFAMIRERWVTLLAIAGLGVSLAIAGLVLGLIGVSMSLEPGLLDIIERVTSSDYNPDIDPVDKAFEDSIRWEWNAGVVLVALGYLLLLVGVYGGMAAGALHFASVRAGRPRDAVSCVGLMARRAPRWFGIYLMWMLGAVVAMALVIGVYILAVATTGALLLLLVPATIAAVIFLWPYGQLSIYALMLAPRDTPPLRHTIALVRADWGGIAIRCLVINLIGFAFNIALNIAGVIPFLGLLIVIPAQFVLYSYYIAAGVLLYEYAGGSVDPEIPAEVHG